MALTGGHRLGPYEIVDAIGAGGMGQVYRARDTRLARDVAIKVLPPSFAGDPERRERFTREAQAVAALSHPNIVSVFDTGVEAGQAYVVMELLEGETLRERLTEGALPVRKAIEYGVQILRGLAAAHDKGLVHRDLKPDNIFLTAAGHVKTLDFGLARVLRETSGTGGTETVAALTDPGHVMGTMGYMAPEQVRARPVDGRADLFAFGAVLHEMVAGRRAFQRDTPADTMTAILKEDPPELSTMRADLPPALDRIVRHCLEKNPAERFQSARDVAFALEALSGTGTGSGTSAVAIAADRGSRPTVGRERLAWALAVVGLVAAGLVWFLRPVSPPADVVRFDLPLPATSTSLQASLALAPNGRSIVVQTTWATGDRLLRLRRLDKTELEPLPGTEGATLPTWSWDSSTIAFRAEGKLRRFDVATSSVRDLVSVSDSAVTGLAYGPDGTLAVSSVNAPLQVLRPGAGTLTPLRPLANDAGEVGHAGPVFTPDGRLLYQSRRKVGVAVTLIQRLDAPDAVELTSDDITIVWAGDDAIGFRRLDDLYVQRVDWSIPALQGEPVLLADQLMAPGINTPRREDLSPAGVLAFVRESNRQQQFTWYDRSGRVLGAAGAPGAYGTWDLYDDGRQIATGLRDEAGRLNLWTIDAERGAATRVTLGDASDVDPRWSPDGQTLIFGSFRDPSRSPYRVRLSADTPTQLFVFPGSIFSLDDWSRDGRWLLYHDARVPTLWARRLDSTVGVEGEPMVAARALTGVIDQGQFSPDGRWIAYNSNETDTHEVYVVPFPPTGQRYTISRGGGLQPTWKADGKELYFLSRDGAIMASSVTVAGTALTSSAPVRLFTPRLPGANPSIEQYAPHAGGTRFLVLDIVGGDANLSIGVVVNWPKLLPR